MTRQHWWVTATVCAFVLGFLCLGSLCPRDAGADVSATILGQKKSVVTLVVRDSKGKIVSLGTGFIVREDGLVATNYHVIEKAVKHTDARSAVKLAGGAMVPLVDLVFSDEDQDIAIVRIAASSLPPVRCAASYRPRVGESVVVIGTPLGLELTVSDGIVSNIHPKFGLVQITAPMSLGSSGSPVFNTGGEVIGIATLTVRAGQNVNFLVPIDPVSKFLAKDGRPQTPRLFTPESPPPRPFIPNRNR